MHPKIGIIICGFNENRQFVPNVYIQSVRYAKGIPLLIPLVRSDRMIDDYVSLCDGFLFCGGEDITPLLFGEEPQNGNGKTDITVDLFQIRLMKRVLASRKPVLAICRGMQILNVSCGGTIWQDLTLCPEHSVNHMQTSKVRSDVCHKIQILQDSYLGQIYSQISLSDSSHNTTTPDSLGYYVNSFHHQAVHQIGHQLKVTAIASDHFTEAIESTAHPFVMGIQWHPESMYHTDLFSKKIFDAFIQASSM